MRRVELVLLLALACAAPARAGFQETSLDPRGTAMGGAMTAVPDDLNGAYFNPGNLGSIKRLRTGVNYQRLYHIPAGETNADLVDLAAGIPVQQELINGTFGLTYIYNRQAGSGVERTTAFGYGSRGFFEREGGGVDLGASLKFLSRNQDAGGGATKPALDLGTTYRFREKYALGFSILNFNRPMLPGGRAPLSVKIGVAETVRRFTMALDLTKREPSGDFGGSATLAGGMEYWWATPRHGSCALRTGLSLGDRSKTWNWGLGWRMLGGELSYAMTVPMQGKTMVGHGVGLMFRFGQSNPEGEYERLLGDELKYRQDLISALEAGEVKQWKLSQDLGNLREELETLRRQLVAKTLSEAEVRKRLAELQERHRKAVEEHERLAEEQRRLRAKTRQDFLNEDWASYSKAKSGGTPDAVLADQVRRILRDYKDSGLDLSEASQELLRLLRAQ